MADIFLSHSSVDNDAADQIRSWLERDRKSWSVFLDKHSRDGILAGQGWQDRLRRELQSCRLVLAIITADWLASRWCFTEAVTATFRGKDFVCVLPGPLPDRALDAAPPIVHERQRQPLDLTTGGGWTDLLHALDRSGLDPNQWFAIPEGVRPYPGFVAFEERDAGVFFGRDQEITQYLDELSLLKAPDRAQALVISGGSGSGKSSLLKAGLIPRLRRQPDWLIVPPFDPSREPLHALFAVLRTAAQGAGAEIDLPQKPPPTVDALTEVLNDSLRAIEDKANAWLLLPLDQAEVLLAGAQGGGETDASRLLAAIGRLLAGRARRLVAVLTIRTEFMPALERTLPPAVRLHDRSLRPLTALSEVIEKPAARFGIELEEGLTGRMVEDTRGADAVPLLAYTLRELYETYGDDDLLKVTEYEQLGGVEGAIEKKLHEALSDPAPTAQELAAFRRCFVRQLVRVDESAIEGERYLRTAVARDALPEEAIRLVDRLREARLLVGGDDGTIGIAHDRLIRNWADAPLQTWLAEDSGDRKLIDNLKSFLAARRDGGPLLSEKPLLDAKDFLERDPSLEGDEPELAEFIEDSVTAEQARLRRQKWQLRGAIAAALVFLGVAMGAIWFYLEAQKQTRVAEEQTRVAEEQTGVAEAQRDRAEKQTELAEERRLIALVRLLSAQARQNSLEQGRPVLVERGAALAVEALRRGAEISVPFSPDLDAAARDLLARLPYARFDHGQSEAGGRVTSMAWNPQGDRLATSGAGDFAFVWAANGRGRPVRLDHGAGFWWLHWNSQGDRLATGGATEWVKLWSADGSGEAITLQHENPVSRMWWSPLGDRLTTLDFDGTARLWSADGQGGPVILRHDAPVKEMAWNAQGDWIATLDENGSVTLRVANGQSEPVPLHHGGPAESMAWSPLGERLATAGTDDVVRLWPADGQGDPILLQHDAPVTSMTWSPLGTRLATVSDNKIVWIWEVDDQGNPIRLGHEEQIRSVAWHPQARRLATLDAEGFVHLWNADGRGAPVRIEHGDWVSEVSWSPSGQSLATSGRDGLVKLWPAEGEGEPTLLEQGERVAEVAWSTQGDILATHDSDSTVVKLWRTDGAGEPIRLADGGPVSQLDWSPRGDKVATAGDGTVRLWASDGQGEPLPFEQDAPVSALAWSPREEWVATGEGGTIRLWPVDGQGEPIALEHGSDLVAMKWSPEGERLATWGVDGVVKLWASEGQGDPVTLLAPAPIWPAPAPRLLSWSPSGDRLAVASGRYGALEILAADGRSERILIESVSQAEEVAWSPQGDRVATLSKGVVSLWAADGGGEPIELGHGLTTMAWNPQGGRLATVDRFGVVESWAGDGQGNPIRFEHGGPVTGIDWSPDGRRLATGGEDGVIKLWAADSPGQPIRLAHGAPISVVAWSPRGDRLATLGHDIVKLWAVSEQLLTWLLCSRGGRNLGVQEWHDYIDPEEPWQPTCESWVIPQDVIDAGLWPSR
ncbi:MAG: TIR domain-containing protein [Geminicoccaceae bacterium]